MKITQHIKQAKDTLFSFEILPPLKGKGIQSIFDGIDPLMEFKPPFIDVTYHREEFVLKERPDGSYDRISIRKRPGTVAICAAIMNKYKVDAVPHLICGGFTREETENALIDLHFLGIHNVLALRGDNVKSETHFKPEPGGNANSYELLCQVREMNQGRYQDQELKDAFPTDFCIGVAGYPEKHFESPNLKTDLKYLKMKVDVGAEYVVTQMFFDNQKYFKYVEACRAMGIEVPIIPGIKPITSKKQLSSIPKAFYLDLPDELTDAISACKNDADARKVGIEWAVMQCKELKKAGVPVLHFYTMGLGEATREIASQVF